MKRLWIAVLIVCAFILNPVIAQDTTGGDTGKTEETTTGDTSGTTDETKTSETKTEEKKESEGKKAEDPVGGLIWTDKNGTLYANSKVKFTLVATDSLSDVDFIEYKFGGGPAFSKYTGAFSIQKPGPHTIVYRSVDKAGNREVDRVFNVVIDNAPPMVRVLASKGFVVKDGKNYTFPGNSFTFLVVDDHSGVKSIEYGINSKELSAYKGDIIKLTGTGTQFIQFRAQDNLGNKTVEGNLVVEVDAARPEVKIIPTSSLIKVGDKQYARRKTGFNIKGMDIGSGVAQIMIRLDGSEEWQTYSGTLSFDTEKEHSIEAKAVDAVGNESPVEKIVFIVDENPPVTKLRTDVKADKKAEDKPADDKTEEDKKTDTPPATEEKKTDGE